jgi:uncharacterized membrane protein (UPF0136 family)
VEEKGFGFFGLLYFVALMQPGLAGLGLVFGFLSRKWWQALLGGVAAGSAYQFYYGFLTPHWLTTWPISVLAGTSWALLVFAAKRGLLGQDE